jgi:transposase
MEVNVLAGIDVSARSLTVCLGIADRRETFEQPNTPQGLKRLCQRLARHGATVRVALEPTGPYSLAPALALAKAGFEVMMVNPKGLQRFASLLTRSKTDALDAGVLLSYLQRMPFVAWQAPSAGCLELQAVTRRMTALIHQQTQEKNRRHAETRRSVSPDVLADLEESLRLLAQRIGQLQKRALELVKQQDDLKRDYRLLLSIKGIGQRSALVLLGELALLPPGLTAPQWVAHAGLDPRHVQSGSSVNKPSRISRCGNVHLRRALYMPALVAVRFEPRIGAFYQQLLGRGKAPLQGLIAVMRKLMHSIYGMLKTQTPFDGEKFRAQSTGTSAAPRQPQEEASFANPLVSVAPISSAEPKVAGQGRRSRRSEPLTRNLARPSSPRRRKAKAAP